jgi:hypothetical protein
MENNMKRQLVALFSLMAIANGINAMEKNPATEKEPAIEIASLQVQVREVSPGLLEEKILQIVFEHVVRNKSVKAIELLLKEGKINIVRALSIAGGSGKIQIVLIKGFITLIQQKNPNLTGKEILQKALAEVVPTGSKEVLELFLKACSKDITGQALETAIGSGLYEKAQLLLQYDSPITDKAWQEAKKWSTDPNSPNDQFEKLLQEKEKKQEEQLQKEKEQLLEEKIKIELARLPGKPGILQLLRIERR